MNDYKDYIITHENPLLRQKCKPIEDLNKAHEIAERLLNLLRKMKGSALAAPQIGEMFRVFVVEVQKNELFPDRKESPTFIIVNPEILEKSDEMIEDAEACFSVPGFQGTVVRHKSIRMRYTTLDGEEVIEEFSGYIAKAMQHEYDHLEGIIYLDKAKDVLKIDIPKYWWSFFKKE